MHGPEAWAVPTVRTSHGAEEGADAIFPSLLIRIRGLQARYVLRQEPRRVTGAAVERRAPLSAGFKSDGDTAGEGAWGAALAVPAHPFPDSVVERGSFAVGHDADGKKGGVPLLSIVVGIVVGELGALRRVCVEAQRRQSWRHHRMAHARTDRVGMRVDQRARAAGVRVCVATPRGVPGGANPWCTCVCVCACHVPGGVVRGRAVCAATSVRTCAVELTTAWAVAWLC